jgi:uncharacterized protein
VSFWDASALVPLILTEPRTDDMRQLLEQDPDISVWWGTRVECTSAIARSVRDGHIDARIEAFARRDQAALFDQAEEVAPSEGVRARAERLLAVHALRAADALQLGAALIWAHERPDQRDFVSLDDRLREAALKEGFSILP